MGAAAANPAPAEPSATAAPGWHLETLLRLADDALVLAQRVSEWCGHGPQLEEDLAMANIGLDLLGQARMLYTHAGSLMHPVRSEDELAYFRDAGEFRNHSIVELPNGAARHDDYAITIVRNYLHSARMVPTWQALGSSTDPQLAAIASKAIKEAIGHLRHARDWLVRLGDGTDESHHRMQLALDHLWPYTNEFWADDDIDRAAADAGVGVLPSSVRDVFMAEVEAGLAEASLARPPDSRFVSTGKQGRHTEHLDWLLAELQTLARQHPGAQW